MNSKSYIRISLFLDKGLLNYTAGHLVNTCVNTYRIIHTGVCSYKIYIYDLQLLPQTCSPFLRVFYFSPFKLQILSACRMMS